MASTLLLDRDAWDLVLDAADNIAAADEPYSLSQDVSSAIKTFQGECYWDTLLGVPYLTEIFGKRPSLALLKARFEAAALTVPDVASVRCFISSLDARTVKGQIQVKSVNTGQTSPTNFSVSNPQGIT